MTWPWLKILRVVEVLIVVGVVLALAEAHVRRRIDESISAALTAYHQQMVVPLVKKGAEPSMPSLPK